jgi:hypothetical protein
MSDQQTATVVRLVQPADTLNTDAADTLNTDAADALAKVAARLASGETRAIAVVEVRRGGTVGTFYSNSHEGHHHQLTSGALTLLRQLSK